MFLEETSMISKKVQLSAKKEEELCAAGKCFKCKEHGHMAWNCPTNNSLKPSSLDKPPELSSFSLVIDLGKTEKLRDACLPECSSLSLGMIDIREDSDSDGLEYFNLPEPNDGHDMIGNDTDYDDLPELESEYNSDDERPQYGNESESLDKLSD